MTEEVIDPTVVVDADLHAMTEVYRARHSISLVVVAVFMVSPAHLAMSGEGIQSRTPGVVSSMVSGITWKRRPCELISMGSNLFHPICPMLSRYKLIHIIYSGFFTIWDLCFIVRIIIPWLMNMTPLRGFGIPMIVIVPHIELGVTSHPSCRHRP